MPLPPRHGRDDEFKFKIGDEFIWSKDNKDYTIVGRVVNESWNVKCYMTTACDPTNPVQNLKIEYSDEDKMTETNCLSVLTKVWPNLIKTGNGEQFMNYILKEVIGKVCDSHEDCTNNIQFHTEGDLFQMTFDGIEFTK